MKKEPLFFFICRCLILLGILFFMMMLYWSSLLLEENVRTIQNSIEKLEDKIEALALTGKPSIQTAIQATPKSRPHIDPSLPNLLSEDPFYLKTLPSLLGEGFVPHGIRHNATVGRPANLHPFNNWVDVSDWTNNCVGSAATLLFGQYETMAPDFAIKIEKRPSKESDAVEYWVHLREGLFWQPLKPSMFSAAIQLSPHFLKKHPVTSQDFKLYFDAIMNPFVQEPGAIALKNYYSDITELRVIDDLTFVVQWRTKNFKDSEGKEVAKPKYMSAQLTGSLKPLPCFVYQYFADGKKIIEEDASPDTYRKNSVWAQNFSQHWARNIIVSCGPWIFEKMSDHQITFKRNPDFYNPYAALCSGIEIFIKDSPDTVWQDFQAGSLDAYNVQPGKLIDVEKFLASDSYQNQIAKGLAIKQLKYLYKGYYYIGWNQAKPYFKSKKVRQALTMAINRERIIQQNLNGLGQQITGTFFYNSPSYDKSIKPWPFDPEAALALLKEEGWEDHDKDGILDKIIDGEVVPFHFTLSYLVKFPTAKSIGEYIATALAQIGISCSLNGVDYPDMSVLMDDKSFDAVSMGWSLGTPPEDPRQLWHSSGAKEKGSSNTIGFANSEADSIIEQLDYEDDTQKRIALYHRFDAIIHDECPYTFLYSPKVILCYREYLQNVFLPADRQDLIPGANIAEPNPSIYWIKSTE